MPNLPERPTDRLALALIAIVIGLVALVVIISAVAVRPRAADVAIADPGTPRPMATTTAPAKAEDGDDHGHDHAHPEKPGTESRAVLFTETFKHDDGLRVQVHAVDHGVVAKRDAHDGVKPHEDYVQLEVTVTNGGHHVIKDTDNLWILSYGPKGQEALQPRLTTLTRVDKPMRGALKPGQSRVARQTFVVPCLCQDEAVLEFTFDQEGHLPSVFTGEIA